MTILDAQINYASLSLKDLLQARDAYHWHLMNKANVVGTAVGLYLTRKPGVGPKEPRTFANSETTPRSWPCILVLVNDWIHSVKFGGTGGIDPTHMVPKTLYLADGRAVPVCIVLVQPGVPANAAPAHARWPASFIGGGCPIFATVQNGEHQASVGCLVSDGHKTYVLTNRHVVGEKGEALSASLRGDMVRVGKAAGKALTRIPFNHVFPDFSLQRTYLTLDIGLIDVDTASDWTSQPFGLEGELGDVADLNEANLGTQLVDAPVEAFGAASGRLTGKIKALFYRYKALAGYDYVSEFLIAPDDGKAQSVPGDSGTVWHVVETSGTPAPSKMPAKGGRAKQPAVIGQPLPARRVLRPIAVEWGGQGFIENGKGTLNFSLATGLSTACQLLDVDLVRGNDPGATPFWGQTGHYSIAATAIGLIGNAALKKFMQANLTNISFEPGSLTPDEIRQALSKGDFVELADVPDLVWKKVAKDVPGGRDYARNAGPEHPNHYADIDKPDGAGLTMRDAVLKKKLPLDPDIWISWYQERGETDKAHLGCLPFRVWQLFDVMVDALKKKKTPTFLCAAGVISHYVGDACQPLHGSYLSNGYQDRPVPTTGKSKKWQGMGVHSAYEDKMVDANSSQLLGMIKPAAQAFKKKMSPIADGKSAAYATIELMDYCADEIEPSELCDVYIQLGGGTSKPVIAGLWKKFGPRTGTVMGIGAKYLAAMWDAAYVLGAKPSLPATKITASKLAAIYQDEDFAPSLTIDKIGTVL